MKTFKVILFLTLFSLVTLAQEKTIIPFTLTEYNNLSIKAVLNQKDTVQLMFHIDTKDRNFYSQLQQTFNGIVHHNRITTIGRKRYAIS